MEMGSRNLRLILNNSGENLHKQSNVKLKHVCELSVAAGGDIVLTVPLTPQLSFAPEIQGYEAISYHYLSQLVAPGMHCIFVYIA